MWLFQQAAPAFTIVEASDNDDEDIDISSIYCFIFLSYILFLYFTLYLQKNLTNYLYFGLATWIKSEKYYECPPLMSAPSNEGPQNDENLMSTPGAH